MKKNLLFLLFVLFTALTNAQSFQKDFYKTDTSNIYIAGDVFEENGKFYTFYEDCPDTNHSNLHYLVLDADNGNTLVDSIIFCDSFPGKFYGVGKVNNKYVFIRKNYNDEINKEGNGKIFVTDTLFNILYESQLPLLGDSTIWNMPGVYTDSYSHLIFIWKQYNDTAQKLFTTFYYKTNLQLDSIGFLSIPFLTYNNLVDDTLINKYVITPLIIDNTDTNIVMFYNYDFTLDTFIRWPNFVQIPPGTSQNYYLRLSPTRFVYASQTVQGDYNNRGMGVYLYGENYHLLTSKSLGASANSSPPDIISMSKINDKFFYYSGMTNWDISGSYNNDTNSIVLYKLDTNLNVIWTKYYKEDLYHYPYYFMTTSDNGCLIFGVLYAHTGFFFLKVDSMGNLQWSHGLDVEEKVALVYPNPVENVLYVDNGLGSGIRANLLLYDVNGRQVISKRLVPQMNNIDVSSLPQGVYFYRIADTKKVYQSGKVVKQ